jgi:6-phosphogluconolactonase
MPAQPEIRILKTAADLFEGAAAEFASQASTAVRASGKFTVALSGGSTPRTLYSLLATKPNLPWDKIFIFWGDERHVPPDQPESNYGMANEALLSRLQYELTLKDFFHLSPGEFPRFDLIFLGVGPDGHTASLFPGTSALNETKRLVVANWVPKFNTHRITFTFPVLNAAACVIFLMSGADKAATLQEVLENNRANLPSQRVRPVNGKLIWLVDEPAARTLSCRPS